MKGLINIIAFFAIIFLLINFVFKKIRRFAEFFDSSGNTVDQNRKVHINIDNQPKVGTNKGEYIDYEDVADIE